APIVGWWNKPATLQTGATQQGSKEVRSEVPLTSQPKSEWLKLTIPAGDKSELIPVPPTGRVEAFGEDIRVHCVYRGGKKEVSFGKGEAPCPKGDMPFVYVTNLNTDGPNIILYAHAF